MTKVKLWLKGVIVNQSLQQFTKGCVVVTVHQWTTNAYDLALEYLKDVRENNSLSRIKPYN